MTKILLTVGCRAHTGGSACAQRLYARHVNRESESLLWSVAEKLEQRGKGDGSDKWRELFSQGSTVLGL